jgi:aspartyl-tRNA(Asn)/glutamyl-tRNA(Gln) amidotransferase subunit A
LTMPAPLAFPLDHVGPMTRTVRDNALMLQVIAGRPGCGQSAIFPI